jgi:hypothetical protein
MGLRAFARKVQVFASVLRCQRFPVGMIYILAGLRHIVGSKIVYALPLNERLDLDSNCSKERDIEVCGDPVLGKITSSGHLLKGYSESPRNRSAPRLLVFPNAYITKQYSCHDSSGNPFWNSVLIRGDLSNASSYPCGYPLKISAPSKYSKRSIENAFFVRYMFFNHFGHALTELVSSIYPLIYWALRDSPELSIPIIVPSQFCEYRQKLASLLGIESSQILVPGVDFECLHVKRLLCAESSFVLKKFVSPFHHQAVKAFLRLEYGESLGRSLDGCHYKKVYISRSRLGFRQRQFVEEKDLERLLEALGWFVFHPQECSLEEQLMVYEGASFICGLEGSAMHLLLGVSCAVLVKVVLLTVDEENDFSLQFDSQGIAYSQLECLVQDDYWPFGRNRNNVRLKNGLTADYLASLIESSVI